MMTKTLAIRFKNDQGNDFPDWVEKKLGEVSRNIGYGMNAAATEFDGVTKYIRITDIDEGSNKFRPNPVTSPDEEAGDRYKLHSGDVVFARTGASVGKSYLYDDADGNLAFAGFLIRFAIREDVAHPAFIFLQTQTHDYWKWVKVNSMRSGQPGINAEEYKTFPVQLPTLPEQQKIANFLTAVDARIGHLIQKKALLTNYKKGVMQQLFTQAIRFKDDQGNEFPDWEEKKLKAVANIYDGTHTTPSYTETGVPFYSVEHLTRGSFERTKFISEEVFAKENKRVKLERGDVLMTRIGDIGTSRHLDWDVRASFYVSLALIKLERDYISSEFAQHSISSRYFQRELWQRTIHVAFPKKINLGEIGECQIRLPSIPEQTKIANFLSAIDLKIESVTTQISETQTFKRGLLQQMFV